MGEMILAVLALLHTQTSLIETAPGELPIVITAPHGGTTALSGPARTGGGAKQFVTVTDTRTDDLARATAAEVEKALGKKPWLIIARFSRKYVDVNRPIESGAETDEARDLWRLYHQAVRKAVSSVRDKFGHGVLLDIHGQGSVAESVFRGTQNLRTVTGLPDEGLSGPKSFLGILEASGVAVSPSCALAHEKENPKLDGGYTVQTYGSQHEDGIFAIQLEFGASYRSKSAVGGTAAKLAKALKSHVDAFLK